MSENKDFKSSSRPKKIGTVVSAYIQKDIYDMLTEHCRISGQSKTKAIERAIESYCGSKLKEERKNE